MLRTGGGMDFTDGGSPRPLSFDTPTAAPDAYMKEAQTFGGDERKKGDDGGLPLAMIVGLVVFVLVVIGVLVYTSGECFPRVSSTLLPS
jgi:hypothetical protein